jgi:transposase
MEPHEESAPPRVVRAQRTQVQQARTLDALLPPEHEARSVWAFVERLDLGGFYAPIKAREGRAGRTPTDPQVLVALLLYAAIDGVGSARDIDRLTHLHDAYRWLRGGVPLNHHMLSDFRVAHPEALDNLLTQSIAVLLHHELVTLKRVAQDGTRVRASAGTGSFHGEDSLQRCLVQAQEQLVWVRREGERADAGRRAAREAAARERAARERLARVEEALRQLPEVQARADKRTRKARASTTDPDARVMKMGDGGYRPAFNVQLASDVDSTAVVGLDVVNSPADAHRMPPMLQQVQARCGSLPEEYLIDAGFIDYDSLERADALDVLVYGPLPNPGRPPKGRPKQDPTVPRADDSSAVVHFRLRMATPEAKALYKRRGEVAERTNAEMKDKRGLTHFLVRGLSKVKCVALWTALAYNVALLHSHQLI